MRILVVGGSQVCYFLAKSMISKGYEVAVINEDTELCRALARNPKMLVLNAPHTDLRHLADAGAREADAIIALCGDDAENHMICQLARTEFDCMRTVALVNDPAHEEVFKELGTDAAISVVGILGSLLQEHLIVDAISDMFHLEDGRILVTEVVVPAGAPAVNKKLSDLNLPEGSILTAIVRKEDKKVVIPGGDTRISREDKVLLVALPGVQGEALRKLAGSSEV